MLSKRILHCQACATQRVVNYDECGIAAPRCYNCGGPMGPKRISSRRPHRSNKPRCKHCGVKFVGQEALEYHEQHCMEAA